MPGGLWLTSPVLVTGPFVATFSFRVSGASAPAAADGLCLALQSQGASATSVSSGSGIGLGGITASVGICFDTFLLDADFPGDSNLFMSTNVRVLRAGERAARSRWRT